MLQFPNLLNSFAEILINLVHPHVAFSLRRCTITSTTLDVVFDYMFEAKETKSKIIPIVILVVIAIGIYIWWDKRQYDQCKSLLSAKISFHSDRIIDCYQRVYGIDLTERGSKASSPLTPLKPGKDSYRIGEDIYYGYLTMKVIGVSRSDNNTISIDIYAYNNKNNSSIININENQFYLERFDKSRVKASSIGTDELYNTYNKTLEPDEGVTTKVYFFVKEEERKSLNFLKIEPFKGSPALTINLNI